MSVKHLILTIGIVLSFVGAVWGQDGGGTMYFLENAPHRFRLNPSYQPEYKVFVGLPGLSGISVNYLNSSFTVEDLLRKRQDSVYVDINRFYKSLRKRNFINLTNENSILTVGVKVNSWYATLDITQKNDFVFRANKDLFTFIRNGNSDYLGKTFDFGKLGLKGSTYAEIALGLSKKVNDKLTVGARLKYLKGFANADMTDSDMSVYTSENGSTMLLKSRQNIRVSAPVDLKYNTSPDGFVEWDDFEVDTDDLTVSRILKTKNNGFAIDLGGEYKFDDKLRFYASLTDLGFIRWKSNLYNFTQNTEFEWKGVDFSNSVNSSNPDNEDLEDAFDDLLDSLKNNFRLQEGASAYTSMLHTRFYMGATYELNKMFDVGGLVQMTLMNKIFYPSLTASANGRFLRNVSASVSYSIMPGNYANIGAAITAKLGPVQLYVSTDNVLAANFTNTQAASARFGINLLFGHKDKKKKEKKVEEIPPVVVVQKVIKIDSVQKPKPDSVTTSIKEVKEVVIPVDGGVMKNFYVIVGSFQSEQNAMKLQTSLRELGFENSVLLRNEQGMYRVAINSYDDMTVAQNNLLEIREKYPQFSDAWFLMTH